MIICAEYQAIFRSEQGVSLIETLVALTILLVVTGGALSSNKLSLNLRGRTERQVAAAQLASDRMELLFAQDPAVLSAANSSTATVTRELQEKTVTFQEVTTIVVNADNSRTYTVSETAVDTPGLTVSISNRVPLWGSQ